MSAKKWQQQRKKLAYELKAMHTHPTEPTSHFDSSGNSINLARSLRDARMGFTLLDASVPKPETYNQCDWHAHTCNGIIVKNCVTQKNKLFEL